MHYIGETATADFILLDFREFQLTFLSVTDMQYGRSKRVDLKILAWAYRLQSWVAHSKLKTILLNSQVVAILLYKTFA